MSSRGSGLRRSWQIPVAALAVAGACACGTPTWHVPDGSAPKFSRDRKVCRQLTDDVDGSERERRQETCMKRRGWRRQHFWDTWTVKW